MAPNVKATLDDQPEQEFVVGKVAQKFASLVKKGDVSAKEFHAAYISFIPVFRSLRPLFSFAEDEVQLRLRQFRGAVDRVGKDDITLRQLVQHETSRNEALVEQAATLNCYHLRNVMLVTESLMTELIEHPDMSLGNAAWKAYNNTISCKHPRPIRSMVWLATFALPSRKTFYERLGVANDGPQQMKSLKSGIAAILQHIQDLLREYQVDGKL